MVVIRTGSGKQLEQNHLLQRWHQRLVKHSVQRAMRIGCSPGHWTGRFAAVKEEEWCGMGESKGKCSRSDCPHMAGPSGEVWQPSHPWGPKATVAKAGPSNRPSGGGPFWFADESKSILCRGPRHKTASKAIIPSHFLIVFAHSSSILCLRIWPDGRYQSFCCCS